MAKTKDQLTIKLIRYLTDKISPLENYQKSFQKEVGENIAKALDNCDRAFEYAAQLSVYSLVREALEGRGSKATFDSIYDHAHDKVLNGASRTGSSTSVTANLFDRCELGAWAELYREMEVMKRRDAAHKS